MAKKLLAMFIVSVVQKLIKVVCISVSTRLGYPDYPGDFSHFLSMSKWVSFGHTHMPNPDQTYLVIFMCIEHCNEISILSNRTVTNIFRSRS